MSKILFLPLYYFLWKRKKVTIVKPKVHHMKELIKRLNFFSLFRILIGAAGAAYGAYAGSVVFVVLGVFLITMAFLNPSCCIGNKCVIKKKKPKTTFTKANDEPAKEG